MCVQDVDVQCVLQFTLIHAAGCALHRPPSRVIHHLELSHMVTVIVRSAAARNEERRANDRGAFLSPPWFFAMKICIREEVHTRVLITSVPTYRRCRAVYWMRPTVPKARGRGRASSVLKATEPRRLRRPKAPEERYPRRVAEPLLAPLRDLVASRGAGPTFWFAILTCLSPFRSHDRNFCFVNDPSAGSPTETLLRLLRPLESTVCPSSRHQRRKRVAAPSGPVQGAH